MNDISFSRACNNFIESLKYNRDTIKVVKISDTETIIMYEDWSEHEPIKNYDSGLKKIRSEEHRKKISQFRLGKKLTPEHRLAISKGKKGKKPDEITRAKISASKTRYYEKMRNENEA